MMDQLNPLKQNLKRRWKYLAIAALVLLVLTGLFAPQRGNQILYGSTYGRAPSGYGAWYQYMADQGTPIERWQKPLETFIAEQGSDDGPVTLLQVGESPIWIEDYAKNQEDLEVWLTQGNRLITLRTQGEVTSAPPRSEIETPLGAVTIETRRRRLTDSSKPEPEEALEARIQLQSQLETSQSEAPQTYALASPVQNSETLESGSINILEDDYGAIAWAEAEGEGSYIYSVTPDLGANAYQNSPGNFAFLAGLVKANGAKLWVNEYSHGYQDKDGSSDAAAVTWGDYFLGTPLMLAWIQLLVLLAIALIALNRRWGLPTPLETPRLNNSEAYIGALAGVLRRSGSNGFVLSQWQSAERQRLQRQLGLGNRPIELTALLTSWEQQTGESADAIKRLLSPIPTGSGSITQLKRWLASLEQVRALSRKHFS